MCIKYFCDKCGKEVGIDDKIFIETQYRGCLNTETILKKEAFICNECKDEYYNKIQEIEEIFGFRVQI